MTSVVLILGLVAAGVYDNNPWFYLAAAVAGTIHALIMAAIAGVSQNVTSELKKINEAKSGINRRLN